ncbi:helix-turn-helix transcriptional regulator [Pseudarthrobacter oxydans]|uniref:helix-turn-helix transcriptional regulator n=1 Tax=Pseudarthrobacter oxydans TaxID=1671 RepID=UPI00344CE0DE
MSDPKLTIADVMRDRNVSRSTIYRRINDGTLTAYRLGPRIIRFDASEVAAAFKK